MDLVSKINVYIIIIIINIIINIIIIIIIFIGVYNYSNSLYESHNDI